MPKIEYCYDSVDDKRVYGYIYILVLYKVCTNLSNLSFVC